MVFHGDRVSVQVKGEESGRQMMVRVAQPRVLSVAGLYSHMWLK